MLPHLARTIVGNVRIFKSFQCNVHVIFTKPWIPDQCDGDNNLDDCDDGDDGDDNIDDGDDGDDNLDDYCDSTDDDDTLDGYPAYSHHDKIPQWWGNVSNDEGGNVSVSKTHHTP